VTAPASGKSRTLVPLSVPSIDAKMESNLQHRMEDVASIGIGVAPEVQKLFDAVRKTTPCVWSPDYTSFIVMDAVRVNAPYTAASCVSVPPTQQPRKQQTPAAQAAAAETMLNRVKKIIDAERAKLKI
jgi:hypothetical protein